MIKPSALVRAILGVVIPAALSAQIHVGPNVHVSVAHKDLVHNEVLLSADPTNPDLLIGCSLAISPDQITIPGGIPVPPWYGVAYMSSDGGKTWKLGAEFKPTAVAAGMDNHCAFGAD